MISVFSVIGPLQLLALPDTKNESLSDYGGDMIAE